MQNQKRPRTARAVLGNKSKEEGITILSLELCHEATVGKIKGVVLAQNQTY